MTVPGLAIGYVNVVSDKEIYENGTVRLEIRDDIVWLQNGMAGFWMQDEEFDNLIEMIIGLFHSPGKE